MNKIYTEYAILDAKIKELETKKESMRISILNEMLEKGEDKIETPVGSFAVTKLKSWTYPQKVLDIGEKFKAEKALAESTGEATFVEKESLRFNSIKI